MRLEIRIRFYQLKRIIQGHQPFQFTRVIRARVGRELSGVDTNQLRMRAALRVNISKDVSSIRMGSE